MSVPKPLRAATETYERERASGASETTALEVAVREALRLAGRPLPATPRGRPTPPP